MFPVLGHMKNVGTKVVNYRSAVLNLTNLPKRCMTHSPPGSGAGKGGGAGGSVKESGGGLGRYGTAQEEGYFHNKTMEEIAKLKEKMKEQEAEQLPKKED